MRADPFDVEFTGALRSDLRPRFLRAVPPAFAAHIDEITAALAREGLFEERAHRGINADLLDAEVWYAVKQSDFDWLTWATSVLGGPVGVLKQLQMLARYRKHRVALTETQARVLLTLRDQPAQTATAAILESVLGPKHGLKATTIQAELEALATARRADGAPAGIVIAEGGAWRAVDL